MVCGIRHFSLDPFHRTLVYNWWERGLEIPLSHPFLSLFVRTKGEVKEFGSSTSSTLLLCYSLNQYEKLTWSIQKNKKIFLVGSFETLVSSLVIPFSFSLRCLNCNNSSEGLWKEQVVPTCHVIGSVLGVHTICLFYQRKGRWLPLVLEYPAPVSTNRFRNRKKDFLYREPVSISVGS